MFSQTDCCVTVSAPSALPILQSADGASGRAVRADTDQGRLGERRTPRAAASAVAADGAARFGRQLSGHQERAVEAARIPGTEWV